MEILILVLLTLSGAVLLLFAFFTAAFRPNRKTPMAATGPYPFVSLLKPIKNIDDDMSANLESFYSLDYPAYEILFAVDNLKDPVVSILKDLQARYPEIRTEILETGHASKENPKVHKLARLEPRSRGALFWVSDSNVRVAPDTLRRLVAESITRNAKIVFSPIRGSSSRSLGSLVENMAMNHFVSGGILTAWALFRRPVIVGKSVLIDRAALKTFGGFRYFKDHLAEDFLFGESFKAGGFRVSTNNTWVTQISRAATLKSTFRRLSRWAKLRFKLRPSVYFGEILLNPIIIAAAGWAVFGRSGWLIFAVTAAVKAILEYANFLILSPEDSRRLGNHLLFPAAVLIKDLLFFAVYLTPFFSREVEWRGGRITLGRDTLILIPSNVENLVYEGA